MTEAATVTAPITRADLESKFRQLADGLDETKQQARGVAIAIGAVAAVAVLTTIYLVGRRRGRKRTTVVEIRRV